MSAVIKKGHRLICVPCGREVIVNSMGISSSTIYCCGHPMKIRSKSFSKKRAGKTVSNRKTAKRR